MSAGGPEIALIVAMAADRVIGRDNALPWRLSSDLARFKALTMGHPIIMGRKTYTSIGRPLPGRRNVVLSRNPTFSADGVEVCPSLDDALAVDAHRVFVIGGEEIYAQALDRATHIFLTQVMATVDGDARFPHVEWDAWSLLAHESHQSDDKNEFDFAFFDFARRPSEQQR
ncbi:MAG: dihydrofolate reductase [Pseudomonadota bacterium]